MSTSCRRFSLVQYYIRWLLLFWIEIFDDCLDGDMNIGSFMKQQNALSHTALFYMAKQTNTCGMISGDESCRTQGPQAFKLLLFHTNLIHVWYSLNPSLLIQLWNAWLRKNTTEQTTRGTWRGHGMPLPWQHLHFSSRSTVDIVEIFHYYNVTQPKSLKYECNWHSKALQKHIYFIFAY